MTNNDNSEKTFRLLSIDAWRDMGGWTWNDWHSLMRVPAEVADYKPRKLFSWLRDNGIASDHSKGKLAVEDDGYNVVIYERSNMRPLWAIEYGVEA